MATTRRIVGRTGNKVIAEARDGLEALEVLATQTPDLLITDNAMPRMDGIQLIAELGRQGKTYPVVLTTSHSKEELRIPPYNGRIIYVDKMDMTGYVGALVGAIKEALKQ